jgi:lysophospholipase L1-like esterase
MQEVLNRNSASARADVRWNVLNFGVNGATAATVTSMAYAKLPEFQQALASRADVVVINLGTNDAHEAVWSEARFTQGIELVVRQLQALQTPTPAIWLVLPPPLLHNNHMFTAQMKMEVPNRLLSSIIRRLATQFDVKVIDGFSPLGGAALSRPDAFEADGCHINTLGRKLLAEAVAAAICDPLLSQLQATPPPLTVAPPKTVRANSSESSDFDDSDSADDKDLFHNVTERVFRATKKTNAKDVDVCGPECCIS